MGNTMYSYKQGEKVLEDYSMGTNRNKSIISGINSMNVSIDLTATGGQKHTIGSMA